MSDFTAVQLLNQLTPVIITGGYVPRGAYAAGTDYAVGDSVDYNGSSYVMYVDAAAGTAPTDTTKWQVLANKGDTGSTGATGSTGSTGATGASITSAAFSSNDIVFTKDDTNTVTLTDAAITLKGATGATGGTGTLEDLGGATKALDNLASVAINTSLISDTDSTDDLGSTTKQWANVHTDRLVSTIADLVIENDLSDGDITFKVNDGGVDTTVMTLDGTTGNVGIGTTAPGKALDVNGAINAATGTSAGYYINTNPVLQQNSAQLLIKGINAPGGQMVFSTGASASTDGYFAFNPLGSEKVRIDSTGNVGIGTTSPTVALDVRSQFAVLSGSHPDVNSMANVFNNFNSYIGLVLKKTGTNTTADYFQVQESTGIIKFLISGSGNVGIGATAPTNILSLGGNSARTFWLERHTTANTAGNILTITAGGATSGATDKAGGDLILTPGLSTGTGESGVQIKGVPAGSTGTTDGTQTLMIQVLGNKFGVFAATPVVKQTGIAALKVDYTAGDLDTEAEIITALNTTNTAINALRTALNNYGFTTVV